MLAGAFEGTVFTWKELSLFFPVVCSETVFLEDAFPRTNLFRRLWLDGLGTNLDDFFRINLSDYFILNTPINHGFVLDFLGPIGVSQLAPSFCLEGSWWLSILLG